MPSNGTVLKAVGVDGPRTASMCQSEVVGSYSKGAVHGRDYTHFHRHVEECFSAARGERGRGGGASPSAAASTGGGVLQQAAADEDCVGGVWWIASLGAGAWGAWA